MTWRKKTRVKIAQARSIAALAELRQEVARLTEECRAMNKKLGIGKNPVAPGLWNMVKGKMRQMGFEITGGSLWVP